MALPRADSAVPLACGVGAAALVGQTVLVRELMASFYGTEVALAAALCAWLLFVPLGALLGVVLLRVTGRDGPLAAGAAVGLALGLPAQFALARLVRPLLGAEPGQFLAAGAMLTGAAVAAAPAALFVGLFFPAASRLAERRSARPARGIGAVYVAEAVGSAVAGAALSFYLLGRVSPVALVLGASSLLLWVTAWWLRRNPLLAACCGVVGGIVAVACLGWAPRLDEAAARARWDALSRFSRVASADTRYQHVEIGRLSGEYVVIQDGRRTAQFPDPPAVREQAALLLTQHPRPREVLAIGGGLGGLCQQLLESPIARLDYVEPDPQLVALLYAHLPDDLLRPLADPRFAAYAFDGRYFVRRCRSAPGSLAGSLLPPPAGGIQGAAAHAPAGRYDLVIVNVGDPTSASTSRFYTVEFCRELAGVLKPGGVAAFCGITASENYVRGDPVLDYTACLYRTVRSVFPWVVVRPGDEFCFFAAAQPGAASSDARVLVARFEALGLQPDPLKHAFRLAQFPPERVEWVTAVLQDAAPTAEVNTDTRPVAFTLFLELQAHYATEAGRPRVATEQGPSVWRRARSASPSWLWVPVALLLVPTGLMRVRRGARRTAAWACGLAVLTTGIFGLATEMLLVYRYQTLFGYVYSDVSAIVGLFMLGLAAGGWLAGRVGGARPERLLIAIQIGQAVVLLALPGLCRLLSFSSPAFMLLPPLVGLLTGSVFPLAARAAIVRGREPGAIAGLYDAADHIGALAGAACAGLVLIPALGVVQAGAVLAVLTCASALAVAVGCFAWRWRGAGRPGP